MLYFQVIEDNMDLHNVLSNLTKTNVQINRTRGYADTARGSSDEPDTASMVIMITGGILIVGLYIANQLLTSNIMK